MYKLLFLIENALVYNVYQSCLRYILHQIRCQISIYM